MNESDWRLAIDDVLRPHRFPRCAGVAPAGRHVPRETIAWEVFRGHLLDSSKNCANGRPLKRGMFLEPAAQASGSDSAAAPLISLKFDATDRRLFVVRHILVHAWEAYEPTPGVIDSRPVQKWAAELVGTIDRGGKKTTARICATRLATLWALALIGTSKLPITSLETPLPAFSLGKIMYFQGVEPAASPHTDVAQLLTGAIHVFIPERWNLCCEASTHGISAELPKRTWLQFAAVLLRPG